MISPIRKEPNQRNARSKGGAISFVIAKIAHWAIFPFRSDRRINRLEFPAEFGAGSPSRFIAPARPRLCRPALVGPALRCSLAGISVLLQGSR